MASKLQLELSTPTGFGHSEFLRRHLLAAHRILRPPLRELSLAIVGEQKMSQLHRRYLNRIGPTDVLSFELDRDARGRVLAGQVVICLTVARRHSRQRGVKLPNELLLYALHGMLHLCKFDDRTPAGFARIHRMEDRILSRLGVGPVFQASGARA
jgi:probable rRNA maturation factor